jgi:hypothetical protein
LFITDPYKAVAVDVAALKANPLLPGGFLVTGLCYDVTTGRIEIVVPPPGHTADATALNAEMGNRDRSKLSLSSRH